MRSVLVIGSSSSGIPISTITKLDNLNNYEFPSNVAKRIFVRLFLQILPEVAQAKDDDPPEDDPHKEFRRPPKEKKVLTRTAPTAVTTAVVDKWLKDNVDRDQHKVVKSQIAEMNRCYNTCKRKTRLNYSPLLWIGDCQ